MNAKEAATKLIGGVLVEALDKAGIRFLWDSDLLMMEHKIKAHSKKPREREDKKQ
ncbi:hypothetical protein RY280_23525 [Bacillus paralicheniformis]|uniref:hypothetical protein n=1 Tax=Bacillus paralicheniformis TaxID=1648923 RepID=UPI00203E9E74|nr:hypothetical protein [Bacillus paralicheniformis]MCM3425589.1 hypothetical protein [Bacillus paralicheniformis]